MIGGVLCIESFENSLVVAADDQDRWWGVRIVVEEVSEAFHDGVGFCTQDVAFASQIAVA